MIVTAPRTARFAHLDLLNPCPGGCCIPGGFMHDSYDWLLWVGFLFMFIMAAAFMGVVLWAIIRVTTALTS